MTSKTVLIAGLGLIGGSLAINIKNNNPNTHILGYDTNQQSISYAQLHGFMDEASYDFHAAVAKSDVVILATPVSVTVQLVKELMKIKDVQKEVIVTDVASVKSPVMEVASQLQDRSITFIGGHPMAGSHKKGIEAARGHLFENAFYVLSPFPGCPTSKVDQLKTLLSGTKSHFIVLNPKEHDEMTGVISHFPHLIASSLVQQAKKWEQTHAYIPKLAAGGFRDITRIASSNPYLWEDIFFHNRPRLTRLLTDWITEMETLKGLLETKDQTSIFRYLQEAKDYRDGLAPKKKGAIPSFYDIYVDIRDQPGALLQVIKLLKSISIRNIQILEIREGITGALRLSFQEALEQKEAKRILEADGYEISIEE
ncbi:prephenate dehydrogenase [Aquibacillus sp. 3ASR75-11]|uniref:Prephenate dehydrogenase n=1 Tax=Terrihalobacillus insolitus TaxID=2950438 RepID=A0A9X3WWV5_9BACI|nr:prephenate dehydrogenase [Terrihalobacillus insolitus]MDC3413047.1 prephenate dehydrogenase [Terrihalobacillus insolitus]MDC3424789.1 prephenate dehydrogenase [Terrihalobacillus insolitus]